MKVRNTEAETELKQLNPGQVFYYYHYNDNPKLYMLTNGNIYLEELLDGCLYAVTLEDGSIEPFKEDLRVHLVDGEFVF